MQLIHKAQELEYRDHRGLDRCVEADIWRDSEHKHLVIVLRGLSPWGNLIDHAHAAAQALLHDWLPYLAAPDTHLLLLALRPERQDGKTRALVLPLSA